MSSFPGAAGKMTQRGRLGSCESLGSGGSGRGE